MMIRSVTGEDAINDLLMGAMAATVGMLAKEEYLTEEQANSFLDQHLCMILAADGGFKAWFKRICPGFQESKILVVRV